MKPKTTTIASLIAGLLDRRKQVIDSSDADRLDQIMYPEAQDAHPRDLMVAFADGRIAEIDATIDTLSAYPLTYNIPTVAEARSWKGMRTGSHGPTFDRRDREET